MVEGSASRAAHREAHTAAVSEAVKVREQQEGAVGRRRNAAAAVVPEGARQAGAGVGRSAATVDGGLQAWEDEVEEGGEEVQQQRKAVSCP